MTAYKREFSNISLAIGPKEDSTTCAWAYVLYFEPEPKGIESPIWMEITFSTTDKTVTSRQRRHTPIGLRTVGVYYLIGFELAYELLTEESQKLLVKAIIEETKKVLEQVGLYPKNLILAIEDTIKAGT